MKLFKFLGRKLCNIFRVKDIHRCKKNLSEKTSLKKTHKNEEIKRFLLGTITSGEELQKIEESLMLDNDYFQEILMQEEELIRRLC